MDEAGSSFSLIKSKRGGQVLLHAGHRYNFVIKNKSGTSNWRCSKKSRCNASITTDSKSQIVRNSNHSCCSDLVQNKIDFFLDQCKKEVQVNLEPIPKVYESCSHKIRHHLREEEIPSYESVKDMLRKARLDYLHLDTLTCKRLSEIKLPNELVKDFFLYDYGSESKILFFATPVAKQYLTKFKIFYGDGTFRVVPSLFYQLYTLHVDLSRGDEAVNFAPLLYILLPDKRQATYEKVFSILRDQFSVVIENFKCDYEIAAINGLRAIFPDVKITGCFYHFSNAVWKKSKKLNFEKVTAPINDEDVNITLLYTRLALLPPNLIPEGYFNIFYIGLETEEFNKFNDYFRTQWMESITSETFSCFNEKFRTTNAVEGWHRRINARIPKKPSLFLFIQLLKTEAIFQDRKIKKYEVFAHEQRRRVKVLKKKDQIDKIISGVINEEFTVLECLKRLAYINA